MKISQNSLEILFLQLGLKAEEMSIYQSLLEIDNASIRKVAEHSGINRGSTYELLKTLVEKGLVSTIKTGQRERYTAESSEKIFLLLQDKRKELWQAQELAKELVPEMLARRAQPQGKPLVRYYEDDVGVVAILKDVLQTCRVLEKPEYVAYSSRQIRQYLYRKFPNFTDKRVEEGIEVKVIAVGEGGDKAAHAERRWLDEPTDGTMSSYMIVYGNKVAHISISENLTPYGVVIEDAGVASMQRTLFENMWRSL
jgi:HTH-type transcriptional regulator, sugar sensing transcriptional regulator